MTDSVHGRRDFLKKMTALGAVAVAGFDKKTAYKPSASFDIRSARSSCGVMRPGEC